MRVLLLADVPNGWIVDRIADRMIENTPGVEFTKGYYACGPIFGDLTKFDAIHFLNWNCEEQLRPFHENRDLPVPIISIRSHRYPESIRQFRDGRTVYHVVNQALAREFPGSVYIPDGIDDRFFRKPIIGFAGKPDIYKGFPLIEQACRELGLEFKPATGDIPPENMPEYYRSIDVLVCASEAEGFGTVVMESLAMGTRVVSVKSGCAYHDSLPGVTWLANRNVHTIKDALAYDIHEASRFLESYRWPRICAKFQALYERVAAKVTA